MTEYHHNLASIIDRYEGFIVDLWGVVHDGRSLYDGILETLLYISDSGKPLVFVSNAPRRATRSLENLKWLGIQNTMFTNLLTSGELTIEHIAHTYNDAPAYFLGPFNERDMVEGTAITLTENLAEAQYILCIGHEYDNQPLDELEPLLQQALTHDTALLCANPDQYIITREGTMFRCAGEIASAYATMGGQVEYFGKPHSAIYQQAQHILDLKPDKILAIGDNPDTDILGAASHGIDSVLLTQGVLSTITHKMGESEIIAYAKQLKAHPTYISKSFSL